LGVGSDRLGGETEPYTFADPAGVNDLVSLSNGEAQGNPALFEQNASKVMESLVRDLPKWIAVLH
jgi:hypothetical protein